MLFFAHDCITVFAFNPMVGFIEFHVIVVPHMYYLHRGAFCTAKIAFIWSTTCSIMLGTIKFMITNRTKIPVLIFIILYDSCIIMLYFCWGKFNAATLAMIRICTESKMLLLVKHRFVTIDANDPMVFFVMIISRTLYMFNIAAMVFCTAADECAKIATGRVMGLYI